MGQFNRAGYQVLGKIRQKAQKEAIPIQATFELTPRCNFNCRMCYVHLPDDNIPAVGQGRELKGEEWLWIAEQCRDIGVLNLCITGGEPICHPEFERIWKGLSQMGFFITLQTNGSRIRGRILELLTEFPPNTAKITLYGSNDQVYREVCGIEEGFARVNQGIQELKKLNISLDLVTTFVKQNLSDVQNIAGYAAGLGVPWRYSTACYPSLRGAKSQAAECALDVWDLGCATETGRIWNDQPLMTEEKKPCAYCSDYRTGFSVTWDGQMRLCLLLNEPQIGIMDQPLEESWKKLLDFCERLRWPDKCYRCEMRFKCRRCVAHLACLNGGIGKVTEDYCHKVGELIRDKE